jgi:large subunit ribosomal protein L3
MKGIVGRKLGMTQVFDEETGQVTPVTVIEAGPCPVVSAPHRHLLELRDLTGATEGESVTVESFEPGDKVKVSGVSIGKGFAGTIKRHNFGRGPTTHGSHNVRKPGSVGASATPSRVFKGIKMAGRLGGKRVTQVGLTVHSIDPEQNLLLVKGAVPGPKNGLVEVREEVKRGGA